MQINKMFGWLLVGVGFAMSTGLAQAGTITFSDSNPNFLTFPGYENYEKYNGVVTDEIGNPHVDSMVVAWNDTTGYLTKVTINFRDTTRIDYDTLFINTDFGTNDSNWHGWDYLVRWDIPDNDGNGVNNIDGTLSSGLYSVADNYTYSTSPAGRTGHPNGITAAGLSLMSDTFRPAHTGNALTYDFSSLSIHLGDSFSIAYAPYCANDLIGGSHDGNEVPEPATMLLFGTGLVGLGVLRRRLRQS